MGSGSQRGGGGTPFSVPSTTGGICMQVDSTAIYTPRQDCVRGVYIWLSVSGGYSAVYMAGSGVSFPPGSASYSSARIGAFLLLKKPPAGGYSAPGRRVLFWGQKPQEGDVTPPVCAIYDTFAPAVPHA